MESELASKVAELRLLVGYLGEKNQNNWWGSGFIGSSSEAFLSPVFTRTLLLSQYRGVSEAALLIHDDRIGVGLNFHLFRLPEAMERASAKIIENKEFEERIKSNLSSPNEALERLQEIAVPEVDRAEGPVAVGEFSDSKLFGLLETAAAHYSRAFAEGYKSYPFMRAG